MKSSSPRDHYSYSVYADEETARSFDKRRFSGPIGELLAGDQARVLTNFVGRIRGRSILDVGTGTGRAALLFARGGAVVTGVDASAEMLAVARKRMADEGIAVTFREGDAHALEFADRSFDVVLCLRVLMHTPKWRVCVSELCRVAERLVILDYPSLRSFALLQSVMRHLLRLIGVRTEAYRVLTDGEVDRALLAAGFRVRSVHRQFVLPIALHKAIGSRKFTTRFERLLDRLGLLKLFGSPVTLVAERCVLS